MLHHIPVLLIYFRLAAGVIILLLSIINPDRTTSWITGLMLAGFFSDIIDGIVARKLRISTVSLRKLDSVIDRIFWLLVLASCFVLYPIFMQSKWILIILVLMLECMVYALCLAKFCKIPSPHNFLSKLWGVAIVLTLTEIIISGNSTWLFTTMIMLGVISRFDSLFIHIFLKRWDHDIPSMYHAYLQRNGRTFKRNNLLNG